MYKKCIKLILNLNAHNIPVIMKQKEKREKKQTNPIKFSINQ